MIYNRNFSNFAEIWCDILYSTNSTYHSVYFTEVHRSWYRVLFCKQFYSWSSTWKAIFERLCWYYQLYRINKKGTKKRYKIVRARCAPSFFLSWIYVVQLFAEKLIKFILFGIRNFGMFFTHHKNTENRLESSTFLLRFAIAANARLQSTYIANAHHYFISEWIVCTIKWKKNQTRSNIWGEWCRLTLITVIHTNRT